MIFRKLTVQFLLIIIKSIRVVSRLLFIQSYVITGTNSFIKHDLDLQNQWIIQSTETDYFYRNTKFQYGVYNQMYNMIEEEEPAGFGNTENYLYFDNSEEVQIRQEQPRLEDIFETLDFDSMNNQEFADLLRKYDLTDKEKELYETKFQKTKRIYKREKAKSRSNASCLKLLQPLSTQTSQSYVKSEVDLASNRQQEIKRKKRMSAQMARDKRKQYMLQIQRQNEALKQRCSQLQAQNKKLKTPKIQTQSNSPQNSSLKSWFIMSLILFSLQKDQDRIGSQNPFNQKIQYPYILTGNSINKLDAQNLISQYQKQPISRRLLDLQQFKHFTDLSQEQQQNLRLKITQGIRTNINFKSTKQSKGLWSSLNNISH